MYKWLICLILFLSVEGSHAQSLDHLQGLKNTSYHHIDSKQLDRGFHIYVRLPAEYEASQKKYPVVYLLDGGNLFPMLASYYHYLFLGGEVTEMIIVGISYGADNFKEGNHRGHDFTAKAESREHYGGAPQFQGFLKNDLLPLIEERYRADPARRIIFGQSLGGQFVLHMAQTDPALFWGHIASNPALHRNLPFFLKKHWGNATTKSKLFVSSGSDDDERFKVPAMKWIDHWSAQGEKPWDLKIAILDGQSHMSAAPAAFRQGLIWLFEK